MVSILFQIFFTNCFFFNFKNLNIVPHIVRIKKLILPFNNYFFFLSKDRFSVSSPLMFIFGLLY